MTHERALEIWGCPCPSLAWDDVTEEEFHQAMTLLSISGELHELVLDGPIFDYKGDLIE
jgi:hypothetical protein